MDNRSNILAENEGKRLDLRLLWLVCFSMFNTWQMGIIYFSGDTLSIDGRTPLPIDIGNLAILIVAGYVISIAFMIFLSRFIVWAERISAGIALLTAITLFIPLKAEILASFYYVHCFFCVFMIGFESAIIINLFTEKTALVHLLVAYAFSNAIIAVLQNDLFKLSFSVFRLVAVIALLFLFIFFFKVPANVWPRYIKKSDNITAPKALLTGIFLLIGSSCIASIFGQTFAESIKHGITIFYLSAAFSGLIIFFLWKRFGITPLQCYKVFAAAIIMGFVAAIVSQYIPVVALLACVLTGAGLSCCWLIPFFGLLIAKHYPSRFVAPVVIGIAFICLMIHTVLLDTLRNNLTMLYSIYLAIAVGLAILYLILEPYLLFSFRNKAAMSKTEATEAISIAKTLTPKLENNWREMLQSNAVEPLTDAEMDIAGYIMLGYNSEAIAKETRYAFNSVRTYRKNLYSKLQIHKIRELFMVAEKIVKE